MRETAPVHCNSRLDTCNSILAGAPVSTVRPLQPIQNTATRLVFNLPKFSHTTPLLHSLHWVFVAARIQFITLVLAYRAVKETAPSYLQAMVKPYAPARPLRSSAIPALTVLSMSLVSLNMLLVICLEGIHSQFWMISTFCSYIVWKWVPTTLSPRSYI